MRFECSPLAAVQVGFELKYHTTGERWISISPNKFCITDRRNSDIISTLGFCYQQLLEHLKQCYLSCALFPKNYTFEKHHLNLIWIGLGFLPLEKVHHINYVDELLERSFFMNPQINNNNNLFRLEEEITDSKEIKIPNNARHLYILANNFIVLEKLHYKNTII